MNQIHDLPTPNTSGHDFNYAVWTANTSVMLCNVSWNSDYRDIVSYGNRENLDNYLFNQSGPTTIIDSVTYAKVGRPIKISLPFNAAYRYNYLRAFNPAQPVSGGDVARAFYYFITDVEYITPNTTQITVQLDVWQTFGYDVQFGNCYVERGHIGIANQNGFADYGREFLAIPEGLDVGGEYEIAKRYSRRLATARDLSSAPAGQIGGNPDPTTDYDVMVVTNVPIMEEPGTVDEPNLNSAGGSNFENLPNGCEVYIFNTAQFKKFMEEFSTKPWVTQGIISIMPIPQWSKYGIPHTQVFLGETVIASKPGAGSLDRLSIPMAVDWRNTIDLGRYANLHKFKTYPYMVLEMTSYTGTPLVIKPESWADPDATVVEVAHFAPPSPRIAMYPYRYNAGSAPAVTDKHGVLNDGGEFLDMATMISNFPTFSIVNNGYLGYLAANSNSIPFQHASADWSQSRALAGADTAYNNANTAMGLATGLTGRSISANTQQTTLANETAGWNALKSGANGMINGGSLVGAGMNVANTAADYAIGLNQRNQSMGISNSLAGDNTALSNSAALKTADSNKDYAQLAAKGDYANTIAGITAKVQDAKMIQPTSSGQIGGEAFNLATHQWGYDVKVKMLQAAAMNSIGEYWLRYGYQVNRFVQNIPTSFMVMEKFTYWKLRETYITSSACPETYKQAIRGIFEKGVTVWSNPADIGNIDIADNAPLTGITL